MKTITGRIYLVHNGSTIRSGYYDRESKKQAFIEAWKRQYGKKFSMDMVMDAPDGLPVKPKPYEPKAGVKTSGLLKKARALKKSNFESF